VSGLTQFLGGANSVAHPVPIYGEGAKVLGG
jgi:hypothetical protein